MKLCVQPYHLWAGTRGENIRDMVEKGRGLVGEMAGSHKLTEVQVVQMRQERADGASQAALAHKYGTTQQHVSEIVRGLVWARVGGPLQVGRVRVR